MTIKERVLATAKTSFAKYGLKKEELDKLVSQIATGLTEESSDEDVTKAVNGIEPYVGMMQSVYNRAVSETNDKYKGWKKPDDPQPPTPPTPPTPPAPPTSSLTAEQVAKMIADANTNNQKAIADAVAAAIAPFKEKEQKEHLSALLQGNEKLKDIPQTFRSRYSLEKEEDLESIAQKVVDDYTALKQDMISSGQFVEAPRQSTPESEEEDFIKQMQGFAERNAPQPSK